MAQQNRNTLRKLDFLVARNSSDNSVQKVVSPKHFQIGLDDPEFNSSTLKVHGRAEIRTGATVLHGITGSIQHLPDGSSYLRQGSNISIVSGSDGSITIGVDGLDSLTSGTKATGTITAIETSKSNLDGDVLTIPDSQSRTVNFTYEQDDSSPTRVNATSYKIAASGISNVDTHAAAIQSAIALAKANGDLSITSTVSGAVVSLVQDTPGTPGNTTISGTAVSQSEVNISQFSGGAISGLTSNSLTAGDGLAFNTGATFNGSAAVTLATDLATNSGLGFSSNKLTIDINALTEATPAAGDFLIIRDANDSGNLKKINFNTINSNAQAGVTLNNALTPGDGLSFVSGRDGTGYNNSNAEQIKINLAANSGLAISSDNLSIAPVGLTNKPSPHANDILIIADSQSSNTLKKVSLSSINSSTSLANSLGPGDGLELASGNSSFNNSSNETIKVKLNGNTLALGSSGLSVASTPGSLTSGTGISSLSYNGSSGVSVAIDTNVVPTFANGGTFSGGVTFSGNVYGKWNKINPSTDFLVAGTNISLSTAASGQITINSNNSIDVGSLSGATPAGGDFLLLEQGGTNSKVTVDSVVNLVNRTSLVEAEDGITITFNGSSNPAKIKVNTAGDTISNGPGGIHVAKVPQSLSDGLGIKDFLFDGSNAASIVIDNSIVATVSGSIFSGDVEFNAGLSGSLQSLPDGTPYLIGGTGIQVTTGSKGQVIITNSGGGSSFRTVGIDADGNGSTDNTLESSENLILKAGTNVTLAESGGVVTINSAGGGTVRSVGVDTDGDGSTDNNLEAGEGLVLKAGTNVTLAESGGVVTINSAGGGSVRAVGVDTDGNGSTDNTLETGESLVLKAGTNTSLAESGGVVTINSTGTDTTYTAGDGLDLTSTTFSLDLKSSGGLVIDSTELKIDNSIVATLTGSNFTGNVKFNSGLSGSLQQLVNGTSYLKEGSNISIVSGSDGSITISSQGGTIGDAEDEDYTDGLFTDFTTTTPVGTPIDRFNEILKLLVPAPAPDLDDIDYNNTFVSKEQVVPSSLSFGTSNDQSSATPAYANVAATAGIGSAVNVNGVYQVANSGNNLRAAVFDGSVDIIGDLNEDVPANITSPSSQTNYVANSFADGNIGNLVLELNGVDIYTLDLTNNSIGAGNPGSGTGNYVNSSGDYEGSGFVNVSIAKAGTFDSGTTFDNFKHRTGRWKIASTGAIGQRNGWNYARVKHIKGGVTKVTNYVEWVKDSDSNALSTSGNSLGFTGSGALQISGVTYNTSGTAQYQVTVSNAYRYVYDTSDITFTTSVSGVNSGVSYSVSNITKPTIGGGENHLKQISVNETDSISASYILGGGITTGINVSHPLKSNLANSGQSTISGLLIYNVSETSNVTTENFQREGYRLQANNYANQSDITGGTLNWDSSQSLVGGSSTHNTGLQIYRERLYSPKNTIHSGDFRNSSDGGSLTNGPSGNPNYSGISGTKTFYRKFQNTGAAKRDFKYAMQGDASLVAHGGTLGSNKNFKLYFKMPSDGSGNTTGWLDAATAFTHGNVADNAGGSIGTVDTSIPIAAPNENKVSFGTVEIGNNEYVVARIEADAGWTGYLDNFVVTFGAVGAVSASPAVNDIDCNQSGVNAKLSFGDDLNKSGYTDVATAAGFSAVNENELYSSSGDRKAVFNRGQVISGDINETTAASGNSYPANSFGGGNANKGTLKLELNGAVIHTTNLESFGSGNDLTSGSGFINLSVATPGEDTNNLPDFTKFYRTGQYQVASGATQRNGWNYVRVIHTIDGSDSASDYVEWVNDDSNQNITFSGVSVGNFASSSTYKSSGISYYINPTGRFDYTSSNVYKYVYSPAADAISYPTTTNCTVSSIQVSGDGVNNGSVSSSTRSLPNLDNSVSDSYDDDITVQATFSYTGTSIPGDSEQTVTLVGRVHHPLMSQAGNIDTSSTTSAVILAANFTDNSTVLIERFNGESKRLKAGSTSYNNQASVSGGSNNWNSATSMNGADAAHNTGLIVYNGKLKSPQKVGLSGDLGDFRDQSEGGQLVAPSGNPDYSSLSNSTREYIRWFQNTTGGSKTDFNLTLEGTGTIVSNATSITSSGNFRVFAKIPNSNSDQTTGFMDTALPFETGQNGDNAGALVGSLDSSLNAQNRVTFGTKFVQNNEYILIKIVADKTWTGNVSKIQISWI